MNLKLLFAITKVFFEINLFKIVFLKNEFLQTKFNAKEWKDFNKTKSYIYVEILQYIQTWFLELDSLLNIWCVLYTWALESTCVSFKLDFESFVETIQTNYDLVKSVT